MQLCDEHVDDISLHTLHIHTYIHRYDDFLIAVISVGLDLAHVNRIHTCKFIVMFHLSMYLEMTSRS